MAVPPPDRSIPENIEQQVRMLEIEAVQQFNIRRFDESRQLYQRMLDLLMQTQSAIERPIHKGTPYHMIGLCFAVTNQHNPALRHIMLAYIEDTLNVGIDFEDEADRTPAARMLRDFYGIQLRILRVVKQLTNEAKQASEWTGITDPEVLLPRLEERARVDTNNLVAHLVHPPPVVQARQPLGFPQPWEERVFIGGSYQTHMPVIRHVENVVRGLGYTPVVAFDVEITREHTHHHTLMLLHTCRYAIFEISSPAGQLMEIERARDYEIAALLLYSTMNPGDSPSQLVSSMLQTTNYRTEGYAQLSDVDPIIREFLPARVGQ